MSWPALPDVVLIERLRPLDECMSLIIRSKFSQFGAPPVTRPLRLPWAPVEMDLADQNLLLAVPAMQGVDSLLMLTANLMYLIPQLSACNKQVNQQRDTQRERGTSAVQPNMLAPNRT